MAEEIDTVRRLANGRPGAFLVHHNDAGVFVSRWKPRLGGGFVNVEGGPPNYPTKAHATDVAREVKEIAQRRLQALSIDPPSDEGADRG